MISQGKKYLKTQKKFYCRIKSRHPSHNCLRKLFLFPFKAVVRLGSTTEVNPDYIQVNSIKAIKNSSNKLLMKQCFTKDDVKTADWWNTKNGELFLSKNLNIDNCQSAELPYPIVAKHIFGSRGRGNTLINNREELEAWVTDKTLSSYIFEKFYNYNREYRLHVTEDGCFYTCRKMLKSDVPEDQRWFRNDSNSVWVLEENELFEKPSNWDEIVEHSVLAMKSVGLDFAAIDVRVQSAKDKHGDIRENPKFVILETNSAPSFGEITAQKYKEIIPQIILKKHDFINSNTNT
jgi:glutathione synthase/RimK-type ligase-like ATP-grasp enzyme